MKYLKQVTIIFTLAFIGELLHILLPFSIPSSVYGLVIFLLLLIGKIIKVEQVKESGQFLINHMSIMFVAPAASIITIWTLVEHKIIPYALITIISTIVVMTIAALISQYLLSKKEN